MAVTVLLSCCGVLLATSVTALFVTRSSAATAVVYAITFTATTVALVAACLALLTETAAPDSVMLPIGLPWLGAHFRLDTLSALFLVITNLGCAMASLYGLGYGQHEQAPRRVLPFFPAFLAGMNLVVLADDAFTFLLTWEFMSLTS
jgi:formate hydrogenlyase subunit 3/multisubunit Na+/H+ antiporter MnhD subunit